MHMPIRQVYVLYKLNAGTLPLRSQANALQIEDWDNPISHPFQGSYAQEERTDAESVPHI